MATSVNAVITTTVLEIDGAVGLIQVDCSKPDGSSFPEQQVAIGATVTFGDGSVLAQGDYIVSATSLDSAGVPLALKGVPYPSVRATITVPPALTGPVTTSLTLTLS